MKKPFTKIASVLLGIVALLQLLRVVFGVSAIIGGFAVPLWFSMFGFLIPGILSIMLWRESDQ
jgi:hypothetical protein